MSRRRKRMENLRDVQKSAANAAAKTLIHGAATAE